MSLPGKICIALLEEDNPLRSFFRLKPLLINQDDTFVPFTEAELYPEDGCIRIVPDKNESGHFKLRMRRLGSIAIIDLTNHPAENDKIRPNKNYHGDDVERNANIIYSDVVLEPQVGAVCSVLDMSPENAGSVILPLKHLAGQVLLRDNGTLSDRIWKASVDTETACFRLEATENTVNPADLMLHSITVSPDETMELAVNVSAFIKKAPEQLAPAVEEAPVQKAPEVVPPEPEIKLPPLPRAVTTEGRSGMNPRKGMSIAEIIDEKWRQSRMDQLGTPVPPMAKGTPLESPAKLAAKAVEEAWQNPAQREELITRLASLEYFEQTFKRFGAAIENSEQEAKLTDLEAQRLEIIGEIEQLKRDKRALRETFKAEIIAENEAAVKASCERAEAHKQECAKWEARCDEAKARADAVEDALRSMEDGRFEKQLQSFAITANSIKWLRETPAPLYEAKGVEYTAEELIDSVIASFAAEGESIDKADAAEMLIAVAQCGTILFSGRADGMLSYRPELLARALGIDDTHLTDKADELALPTMSVIHDWNTKHAPSPAPAIPGCRLVSMTVQDSARPVPAALLSRSYFLRTEDCPADAPWTPAKPVVFESKAPVTADALRAAFAPKADTLPEAMTARLAQLRADLSTVHLTFSRGTLNALWNGCAAMVEHTTLSPIAILDRLLAARALPALIAEASVEALAHIPAFLSDLPKCKALFDQPLPIEI